MKPGQKVRERIFRGHSASPGVAIGTAVKLISARYLVPKVRLDRVQLPREFRRLERAIVQSRKQLLRIKRDLVRKLGGEHGYLLDAQLLMLEDRSLLQDIHNTIGKERVNAEWAVKTVTDRFLDVYASLKDAYFRDRGGDIEDLKDRLIRNLLGCPRNGLSQVQGDLVLIASDLNPSLFVDMDLARVRGLAIDTGGWTSHTAIIARSLRIPAVVGLSSAFEKVRAGETVIVDGNQGIVVPSPSKRWLQKYESQREQGRTYPIASDLAQLPAVTRDGIRIRIEANTEDPSAAREALLQGAEGIGLFRSEFLFLGTGERPPTEAQHFRVYKELAECIAPRAAAIRTLDIGSDKIAAFNGAHETNPALGLRGIRLSLKVRPLFRNQLRAILRASAYGSLKIVLPMVSTVEEVREARGMVRSLQQDLDRAGIPQDRDLELGVMIEVPAAVLVAEGIAREADFLCIGTNDLIQYTLAVDRMNEKVASLYQQFHPAVLRSIRAVLAAAKKHKRVVKLCGEMATDPRAVAVLLGLGVTHFSMNPSSIPTIKQVIRAVRFRDAVQWAHRVTGVSSTGEVERFLSTVVPQWGRSP